MILLLLEFSEGDTRWVGTLRWSAPEVISIPSQPRTIEYNTKSDVFAFAMTFWEMMYNQLPYHEYHFDYQVRCFYMHLRQVLVELRRINQHLNTLTNKRKIACFC